MSTSSATRCVTVQASAAPRRRRAPIRTLTRTGVVGLACLIATGIGGGRSEARPATDGLAASCFRTAGGALEICRDGSEAEGVLAAPRACAFVRGAQLLHLARSTPSGSVVSVYQGESPVSGRGREDECPERRATDTRDGGTLRTGRNPEQLAMILAQAEARFGVALPEPRERRGRRKRGEAQDQDSASGAREGIGPRSPIAISGRDWAGEAYFYVFLLGQEAAPSSVTGPAFSPPPDEPRRRRRSRRPDEAPADEGLRRRVQIEARTLDFVTFEIRTRAEDGGGSVWTPLGGEAKGRRREAPTPATVLDESGQPLVAACGAAPFETAGLEGSISIVDRMYHYFYTDVLPEDCGLPPEKRRLGLYLRTSQDLAADRVWSAPRRLGGALPPGSLVRVARARDLQGWAIAYSCYRPANAPGGPVADICLQYTADLDPAGIGALTLFAEPLEAARSTAYLGLRSGGDGAGRFDRSAHFWMTDAYGNLDVPMTYAGKSGVLTWTDRLAPGPGGAAGSRIYGRPAYWATWTVRRTGTP